MTTIAPPLQSLTVLIAYLYQRIRSDYSVCKSTIDIEKNLKILLTDEVFLTSSKEKSPDYL